MGHQIEICQQWTLTIFFLRFLSCRQKVHPLLCIICIRQVFHFVGKFHSSVCLSVCFSFLPSKLPLKFALNTEQNAKWKKEGGERERVIAPPEWELERLPWIPIKFACVRVLGGGGLYWCYVTSNGKAFFKICTHTHSLSLSHTHTHTPTKKTGLFSFSYVFFVSVRMGVPKCAGS